MKNFEVELHFIGDESYMTVTPVQASCVTELENKARELQIAAGFRTQIEKTKNGGERRRIIGLNAEHVSFGPVIQRDEYGAPINPMAGTKKARGPHASQS